MWLLRALLSEENRRDADPGLFAERLERQSSSIVGGPSVASHADPPVVGNRTAASTDSPHLARLRGDELSPNCLAPLQREAQASRARPKSTAT